MEFKVPSAKNNPLNMITNILKVLLEHDFLSAKFYQPFLGQIKFVWFYNICRNTCRGGGGTNS